MTRHGDVSDVVRGPVHSPGTRSVGGRSRGGFLLAALLWCPAAAALADAPPVLEIAAIPEANPPFVTRILAPHAECMAVSDVADALAVGFRYGGPPEVWIHKLDAAGAVVAGGPVRIPLLQPAALPDAPVGTLALAFHPTLPLLYVWQDVKIRHPIGKPDDNPVFQAIDHLLVVDLAGGSPTVAAAVCRGPEYAYHSGDGEFAFSRDAARLYLPNLRMPTPEVDSLVAAVGYVEIDAAGMPLMVEGKPRLVLEGVAPVLGHPNSYGMVPVSDDVWIFPSTHGPMTLDRTNRRGRITGLVCISPAHAGHLAAHPLLPIVYATSMGYSTAFRSEHVDGFLSGVVQRVTFPGIGLTTPPLVMARRRTIAWGCRGCVVLLTIDDAGRFTRDAVRVPVKSSAVGGLAWSEKFDRLYVAVETE